MLGPSDTDARNVALAQSRAYDRRHLLYSWEGAPFGVSLLDAEGHILQSNEAMRSITGYDVPTDVAPDGADAPAPATHTATRRARRAARRFPSHLGK